MLIEQGEGGPPIPADVPVTPDTSPAPICVRRRIGNGGMATLASTSISTMAPASACCVDVEAVATIHAPMIVPGMRPAKIHPTPGRSSASSS